MTPPGITAPASSPNDASGHRHRRQALVARADRDDAAPRRQAADEPAEDERGVVAVRERVEHPGRSLRSPVARVGDVRRERQGAEPVELLRRLPHEQADLPVAGVVAERHRRPVVRAQAPLRGEDQERVARRLRRAPSPCRRSATARRRRRRAGRAAARASAAAVPAGPRPRSRRRRGPRSLSCIGRGRGRSRT